MDLVTRGTATLNRAEDDLRKLVAEAATAGEYSHVVTLAAWARGIRDLLGDLRGASDRSARDLEPAAAPTKALLPTSRTRRLDSEYPRFYRQGDRLIRVAWSKRDRKEYEHRASLSAISATATAISKKGANGRVFSTAEILPILDTEGEEVPAYQPYAVIALLKQAGLLDQHGRQGYSITQAENFAAAVDAVWRNLPEK